jgi:hypothetical protein
MATQTLTPNSGSTTGAVTGAGGDLDTALSDVNLTTFVTLDPSEYALVGLTNTSLPAGAKILALIVQTLAAKEGTGWFVPLDTLLAIAGESPHSTVNMTWGFATTFNSLIVGPYTAAEIDAAQIRLLNTAASGKAKVHEVSLLVIYVPKPELTLNLPTGTYTDTNNPKLDWTPELDSSGGDQSHYEAKVFSNAVHGGGGFDPETSTAEWDSGVVASATHSTSPDPLADGVHWTYVRIAQTVNGELLWGDWVSQSFTINVDRPAAPTLTLVAQSDDARVAVVCEANAGDATTDYFEAQRSADGGSNWEFVRTPNEDGTISVDDGVGGTLDYEAPNGVACLYRARAVHVYDEDLVAASAWVQGTATWSSREVWVKHPTLVSQNRTFTARSRPDRNRVGRQGVFQALGATYPMAVSDTRGGPTGNLTLLTESQADRDDLDQLLDGGVPLLLQFPAAAGEPDRWVVFAEQGTQRIADKSWVRDMDESLPWSQVARPTNAQLVLYGLFPADELYPSDDLFPA